MASNGLKETLAAMQRAKIAGAEAAMQRLVKGANDIADLQRQLVPVDEGDLRDSITVTLPGQSTPYFSQPGGNRVAGEHEVIVTAGNEDVRYPHLVEHGSVKMEARPYFHVAYRMLINSIKRGTATTFNRTINKEWDR